MIQLIYGFYIMAVLVSFLWDATEASAYTRVLPSRGFEALQTLFFQR